MKRKIVIQGILLVALFFALWAFFKFIFPDNWKYTSELSISNEEKIGKVLVNVFLSDNQKITNEKVTDAITIIGKRLKHGIEMPRYRYKFYVVESDKVNAFTLPGGNIVIYTGLIDLCDNPEQLASVMAHEMGHAENKHIVSRLIKEFGLTVLVGVIFNDNSGVLTSVLKSVISTKFDRNQEREADEFALKTMEASGILPIHFADLFEKIEEKEGGYSEAMQIVMTHPHNRERIKMAQLYKVKKDFEEIPFDDIDFDEVKENLSEGI